MISIDSAYREWLKSRSLHELVNRIVVPPYGIEKVISRHLLTNINETRDMFKSTDTQLLKFTRELKDLGLNPKVISDILTAFNSLDLINAAPSNVLKVTGSNIEYGEFKQTVKWSALKSLPNVPTHTDIAIGMMLYSAMRNSPNQWCITLEDYKDYMRQGATVEGFATPFHSQMRRLNPDIKFCSAFESDKALGSMGSFFDCDFDGEVVVCNPPFIESILLMVAHKCHSQLHKYRVKFIIICPIWEDSEFFKILTSSPYLISSVVHRRGRYTYEDTSGGRIGTNFDSVTFILRN
jgi:hypothetical protein